MKETSTFVAIPDHNKSMQEFPLPIELDRRILDLIQEDDENDFQSRRAIRDTLVAYSTTCHRFRYLVLPRLFSRFQLYGDGDKGAKMKEFCQLWSKKDEMATRCAQHIKLCIVYGGSHFGRPELNVPNHESLLSLSMLPNLTSLVLISTDIPTQILITILHATRIEHLSFQGHGIPIFHVRKSEMGNNICNTISTHATSLKSLSFAYCAMVPEFDVLSAGKFKLERLFANYLDEGTIGLDPEDLQSFLQLTPSITTLDLCARIWDISSLSRLAPTDLPHLQELTCTLSSALILLPGSRPIQNLQLFCDYENLDSSHHAQFTDALRRSSRSLRVVKGLPPIFSTGDWIEYTPRLETLNVSTPLDPSQSKFKDFTHVITNVGASAKPDSLFEWQHLFELAIFPRMSAWDDHSSQIDEYLVNIKQQRADVTSLCTRFTSLSRVELGPFCTWTRPLDAPEEWRLRILQDEYFTFGAMVAQYAEDDITALDQWDWDGILRGVFERWNVMPHKLIRLP